MGVGDIVVAVLWQHGAWSALATGPMKLRDCKASYSDLAG